MLRSFISGCLGHADKPQKELSPFPARAHRGKARSLPPNSWHRQGVQGAYADAQSVLPDSDDSYGLFGNMHSRGSKPEVWGPKRQSCESSSRLACTGSDSSSLIMEEGSLSGADGGRSFASACPSFVQHLDGTSSSTKMRVYANPLSESSLADMGGLRHAALFSSESGDHGVQAHISVRPDFTPSQTPALHQARSGQDHALGDPLDLALDDVIGEAHQVHGMTSPTPFAPLVQQSCPGTPGDHPAVGHGDDQAFATHLLDQLQRLLEEVAADTATAAHAATAAAKSNRSAPPSTQHSVPLPPHNLDQRDSSHGTRPYAPTPTAFMTPPSSPPRPYMYHDVHGYPGTPASPCHFSSPMPAHCSTPPYPSTPTYAGLQPFCAMHPSQTNQNLPCGWGVYAAPHSHPWYTVHPHLYSTASNHPQPMPAAPPPQPLPSHPSSPHGSFVSGAAAPFHPFSSQHVPPLLSVPARPSTPCSYFEAQAPWRPITASNASAATHAPQYGVTASAQEHPPPFPPPPYALPPFHTHMLGITPQGQVPQSHALYIQPHPPPPLSSLPVHAPHMQRTHSFCTPPSSPPVPCHAHYPNHSHSFHTPNSHVASPPHHPPQSPANSPLLPPTPPGQQQPPPSRPVIPDAPPSPTPVNPVPLEPLLSPRPSVAQGPHWQLATSPPPISLQDSPAHIPCSLPPALAPLPPPCCSSEPGGAGSPAAAAAAAADEQARDAGYGAGPTPAPYSEDAASVDPGPAMFTAATAAAAASPGHGVRGASRRSSSLRGSKPHMSNASAHGGSCHGSGYVSPTLTALNSKLDSLSGMAGGMAEKLAAHLAALGPPRPHASTTASTSTLASSDHANRHQQHPAAPQHADMAASMLERQGGGHSQRGQETLQRVAHSAQSKAAPGQQQYPQHEAQPQHQVQLPSSAKEWAGSDVAGTLCAAKPAAGLSAAPRLSSADGTTVPAHGGIESSSFLTVAQAHCVRMREIRGALQQQQDKQEQQQPRADLLLQ